MTPSPLTCPCGCAVYLLPGPGYRGWHWSAACPDCYDPTEGGGPGSIVTGCGATALEALETWREAAELAHDQDMAQITDAQRALIAALEQQITLEAARQRAIRERDLLEAARREHTTTTTTTTTTEKQGT